MIKNEPENKLSLKHLQALLGKDSPMQALLWISVSGMQAPANGPRFVQKQEENLLSVEDPKLTFIEFEIYN